MARSGARWWWVLALGGLADVALGVVEGALPTLIAGVVLTVAVTVARIVAPMPAAPQIAAPAPTGTLAERNRADYIAGRIGVISYLARVESLFDARIAEVQDWDSVDWTTDRLEPTRGRWEWAEDRLVPAQGLAGVISLPKMTPAEYERAKTQWETPHSGPVTYQPGGMGPSVVLGGPDACTTCHGPLSGMLGGLCHQCAVQAAEVQRRRWERERLRERIVGLPPKTVTTANARIATCEACDKTGWNAGYVHRAGQLLCGNCYAAIPNGWDAGKPWDGIPF